MGINPLGDCDELINFPKFKLSEIYVLFIIFFL
jgi:hypothetical protein